MLKTYDQLCSRKIKKFFSLIPPSKEVFTLKVSVIVPTFNEALILEDSLRAISDLNPHEIIVADGGSTDKTLSLARRIATHVVTSRVGRAEQMNAGAKKATGIFSCSCMPTTNYPNKVSKKWLK